MKQSLQLKLGQQLTMTPQLQQAIRLLQLSSLELQSEIQEILETNPLLENAEDSASEESAKSDQNSEDSQGSEASSESDRNVEASASAEREIDNTDSSDSIPNDLPVDSSWDDTFDNYMPTRSAESEMRTFEQADHSDENPA